MGLPGGTAGISWSLKRERGDSENAVTMSLETGFLFLKQGRKAVQGNCGEGLLEHVRHLASASGGCSRACLGRRTDGTRALGSLGTCRR